MKGIWISYHSIRGFEFNKDVAACHTSAARADKDSVRPRQHVTSPPAVIEYCKDPYWSLMHRVECPTLCPENGALIWWNFVVVGWMGLVMLSCSFLWTFKGAPELREPQPESVDDLSDGISSQNMTTRLSAVPADPSVTKFRFLDLDFRRTPNILNQSSGASKL